MLEQTQNSDPLLRQFHLFYVELARLRRMAEGRPAQTEGAPDAVAETPPTGVPELAAVAADGTKGEPALIAVRSAAEIGAPLRGAPVDPVTLRVWQEMAQYLDQKLYETRTSVNQLSRDLMEELVYILAAFADETFLCLMDWPGREYWRDHLMEMRLFGSRVSGQLIFSRIDNLLSRQDFGADEICAIYLTILALGFRGRYLREPEAIEGYRQRLFDRLLLNHPDLRSDGLRLLPEAYRHTVVEGSPVRLPEPKRWWLIVAGILGLWLVLSTITWLLLTIPTHTALERTMRSLKQVTVWHSEDESDSKWEVLPLLRREGAFRVDLQAPLPLRHAGAGGDLDNVVAPLLIAVSGEGNALAGQPTEIRAWLAHGSIAFQSEGGRAALQSRPLQSVEIWHEPPGGTAVSAATQYFLVTPTLSAAELGQRPQLIFPVEEKNPLLVRSMVLYIPQQATAGGR